MNPRAIRNGLVEFGESKNRTENLLSAPQNSRRSSQKGSATVTLSFRERKACGEKFAMLTAYDYPMARLLDESDVDLVLVGDSLGMVVLGYPDTTSVTMEHMVHHCRAVVRGVNSAFVVADLPIGSVDTPELAVQNATRLHEAGAHGVKLEGGASRSREIAAIVAAGIPVMGHIGMLPQRVRVEGGYKIKGKTPTEAGQLYADAVAVKKAGAFAVVMELVRPEVARKITATMTIPTIGIGSGPDCDGQVLVIHDLIGLFPWFTPKFVAPRARVAGSIREAVQNFVQDTKAAGEPYLTKSHDQSLVLEKSSLPGQGSLERKNNQSLHCRNLNSVQGQIEPEASGC
ncbi:MAG TPA: 3-methyl-2-oxobutanoate hydroxymethyltransferase [Verrucomicrobiae bacterium]|nr:3-methyl-2-oxobutanoate hydroxymethyltransferase [Verrucomicrobiae bacterium]